MSNTAYNLNRFVTAQAPVYDQVLSELRAGKKRGHWMWFIFPQLRGLGQSEMSQWYGISSLEEAAAYGRHPLLGPRLIECTQLVNGLRIHSIREMFPPPDDLKFRSSMTLFREALPEIPIFDEALQKYYGGQADALTLRLLG